MLENKRYSTRYQMCKARVAISLTVLERIAIFGMEVPARPTWRVSEGVCNARECRTIVAYPHLCRSCVNGAGSTCSEPAGCTAAHAARPQPGLLRRLLYDRSSAR